jgi:hypothetical protein
VGERVDRVFGMLSATWEVETLLVYDFQSSIGPDAAESVDKIFGHLEDRDAPRMCQTVPIDADTTKRCKQGIFLSSLSIVRVWKVND